jgi:hypothetical protein
MAKHGKVGKETLSSEDVIPWRERITRRVPTKALKNPKTSLNPDAIAYADLTN